MIYFVLQQDRYVKIGYTGDDPEGRLMSLQTGNPFVLQLYKVIQGDMATEALLHAMFADEHISGEWFYFTKKIKKYVDESHPGDLYQGYGELVIEAAAMEDWDRFRFKHKGYIKTKLTDMLGNILDDWIANKDKDKV